MTDPLTEDDRRTLGIEPDSAAAGIIDRYGEPDEIIAVQDTSIELHIDASGDRDLLRAIVEEAAIELVAKLRATPGIIEPSINRVWDDPPCTIRAIPGSAIYDDD